MAIAALVWLAYQFWRLLLGDAPIWPTSPSGAIDLKLMHQLVHEWFAGRRVYGELKTAVYPPATYVLLWPLVGWLDVGPARWLWGLTSGHRARRDHLSPASRERGGGPPRASLRRPAAVLDLRHRRGHRQRTAHRPPAPHAARGHPPSPARASRMAGGPDRVGPHRRGDGQAADRGALSLARALPATVVAARVAGGDRLRSTDPLRAVLPGGHTGRNDPRPALEERGVRHRQRARQRVEPPCLAGDAGAADVDLPRVAARVAGARLLDLSPPGRRSLGSAGGRRDRGLLLDLPSVVRRRAAAAADGGAVPDGEAWVRGGGRPAWRGRSSCRWRPAGFSCCRHR